LGAKIFQHFSSVVSVFKKQGVLQQNPIYGLTPFSINDPYLKHPYSPSDLSGKTANKLELQKEFGLPVAASLPLFGGIGRLAEQKGVEIMLGALEEMLKTRMQFVAVGSGAPALQRAYQDLAHRYPSQVAVRIGFDEGLSHRIEAGCDFFLMPSRFEPCGLNQMYGLRCGFR
jgi:starch synthase